MERKNQKPISSKIFEFCQAFGACEVTQRKSSLREWIDLGSAILGLVIPDGRLVIPYRGNRAINALLEAQTESIVSELMPPMEVIYFNDPSIIYTKLDEHGAPYVYAKTYYVKPR